MENEIKFKLKDGMYCYLPEGPVPKDLLVALKATEYSVDQDEVEYLHCWSLMGMSCGVVSFYDKPLAFDDFPEQLTYERFLSSLKM